MQRNVNDWRVALERRKMPPMSRTLPAFFQLLNATWAAPLAQRDMELALGRFDVALLQEDDFHNCAVTPVRGAAKHQSEHLAGRLCAQQALLRLGQPATVIARGADGVPQWPAATIGSITHGNGLSGAVVGLSEQWAGLGLDLERQLSTARAQRLGAEILTSKELELAKLLSAEAFAQHVTLTFSLKESLFKALYPLVHKRFYFHDAELSRLDAENAELHLLTDLSAEWPAGSVLHGRFVEQDGYLLSLVTIAAR